MADYSMKLLSVCMICAALVLARESDAQPQSTYQQGLEQLYRGEVDEALALWEANYEESARVDARIGFEYIRIITEREFDDHFETATDMYYKALLNGTGVNSRIAVRQEIERLKTIVGSGIYRQWTEWWEAESRNLVTDMRGYWVQLDPTPSRKVNERLIEHWQRIAEARKRFTKNSSTIYGTDDRALVYIRYGEPARIQTGILTLQNLNVKPWLERQIIQRDTNPGEGQEMSVRQTDQGSLQSYPELQTEALEFVIYENHHYPEYEVWFYDELASTEHDTVPFIFGTNIRNDQFELQSSIEDFIPERAYNTDAYGDRTMVNFTRAGITPALMLQMLYYEQLSSIDPFFEQRLNRLRDLILEQEREVYTGADLQFKSETIELIRQRELQAPRQISTIESKIPQIPVDVYQYRFLDENHNPYLVTFLESEPREAFMIDFIRNRPDTISLSDLLLSDTVIDLVPSYNLEHSLQMYDSEWLVQHKEMREPGFGLQRNEFRPGALSEFRSSHNERGQRSVSAELKNLDPESRSTALDTPYPPSTRGLGSLHYKEPEPLMSNPDSLQMADLVLGYQLQDERDERLFPFIVANNQTIPWRETLVLHFEVYNLEVQPNSFSRFELTYWILPVDDNGKVLTDQSEFILTLNFTTEENRLIEDLEIETADLNPGLYELRVQITDVNSDQLKNRNTRFEVLE